MANIIYQKNPDALIPQGNRTVSTFPSGLVKVDQSFIGLTSLKGSHRSILSIGRSFPGNNSPAIDGLYIYPEVQEKELPTGFTEYLVSAYGRTTTLAGDIKNKYRAGLVSSNLGFMFLETQATAVVTGTQPYGFANTGLSGEYYPVRPFDTMPEEDAPPLTITTGPDPRPSIAVQTFVDPSGFLFKLNCYRGLIRNFSFDYSDPFIYQIDIKNYGYFNELTFRTSIDWRFASYLERDRMFFG
jgi:hypothetical protein